MININKPRTHLRQPLTHSSSLQSPKTIKNKKNQNNNPKHTPQVLRNSPQRAERLRNSLRTTAVAVETLRLSLVGVFAGKLGM